MPGAKARNGLHRDPRRRDRRFPERSRKPGVARSRSSRYTFHITAAWRIIPTTGGLSTCSPSGGAQHRGRGSAMGISGGGSEAKQGRTYPTQ